MKKFYAVFVSLLLLSSFNDLKSQTCVINSAGDFCAQCPGNISGTGVISGTITIDLPSNTTYNLPSSCGGDDLSFGTVTFNVSSNDDFVIPGDIGITAASSVDFVGTGSATIVANGTTYTANGGGGTSTFTDLETIIANCADAAPGCDDLAQAILPVELSNFEAKSKDNMVELAWTTASELNNEFFQVEHSRDGLNFNSIGKVKGEGTTSETIAYDFMHRQPIAGANYYRLKQVDFDGAFEYSNVVVAVLANRTGGVQVYPNPTINKATISMNERPENIKFRLSNLLGQGIDLQPNQIDGGWELDLSSLSNGIYVLRMDYNGQVISKRIVKE